MQTKDYTELLESAVADTGITGASFAYWDGERLHTAVAGMRNSLTRDPVTTDTVMHIGSITKIFNTVVLMQLVEEGRIALDDPVLQHLPELRIRDIDALQKITCQMLVNHTNGIDGEILEALGPDQERIVDAIVQCAQLGQLHPPGGGPSYSNIGTVIAGYLSQQLRGESWYTLIKERIYRPLEMRHAIAHFADLPLFRQSVGDLTDRATGRLVQTTRPFLTASCAPCGTTLMMSASALVTFARAMLGGGVGPNGARILSLSSVDRMATPTMKMLHPDTWQWGLGWMLAPGGVMTHGGGGPGVNSTFYIHPQSGQGLALLTNCDRGSQIAPFMIDPIVESWTGLKKESPARHVKAVDPKPYEGMYHGGGAQTEISEQNGHLTMRSRAPFKYYDNVSLEFGSRVTLYPLGDHLFEVDSGSPGIRGLEMKFIRPDSNGRMKAFAPGFRIQVREGAHI